MYAYYAKLYVLVVVVHKASTTLTLIINIQKVGAII